MVKKLRYMQILCLRLTNITERWSWTFCQLLHPLADLWWGMVGHVPHHYFFLKSWSVIKKNQKTCPKIDVNMDKCPTKIQLFTLYNVYQPSTWVDRHSQKKLICFSKLFLSPQLFYQLCLSLLPWVLTSHEVDNLEYWRRPALSAVTDGRWGRNVTVVLAHILCWR